MDCSNVKVKTENIDNPLNFELTDTDDTYEDVYVKDEIVEHPIESALLRKDHCTVITVSNTFKSDVVTKQENCVNETNTESLVHASNIKVENIDLKVERNDYNDNPQESISSSGNAENFNDDISKCPTTQIATDCFQKSTEEHSPAPMKCTNTDTEDSDEDVYVKDEIDIVEHPIESALLNNECTQKSSEELSSAAMKSTNIEPHSCPICGKQYKRKQTLIMHMRRHGDKHFACNLCEKRFVFNYDLRSHLLIHSKDSPLKCNVCSKVLSNKYTLKNHMAMHYKNLKVSCTLCPKQYASESDLRKHISRHKGDYKYNICDRTFSRKYRLNNYVRTHTDCTQKSTEGHLPAPMKCANTDSEDSYEDVYVKDEIDIVEHPIESALLTEDCTQKSTEELPPASMKSKKIELHSCPICGKQYKLRSTLVRHMKRHACNLCEKRFLFNCDLKIHILEHSEDSSLKCNVCCKVLTDKYDLKRHMAIHYRKSKLSCPLCPKQYTSESGLRHHIGSHKGDYKCNFCDKTFSRKNQLDDHVRSHTGAKPFGCKICKKQYTRKTSLNNHIKYHVNPEEGFTCDICQKVYYRKDGLRYHIVYTHMKINSS